MLGGDAGHPHGHCIEGLGILPTAGAVRLRGGAHRVEGTVEVYANSVWGAVCSSHWDDADAAVVCHQLQLGRKGVAEHTPLSGLGRIPVHWSGVRCRGDEESLQLCARDAWRGGVCPRVSGGGVTVSDFPGAGPASPVLRLAGGSSVHEGRVELYHAGQWGTVCDDQWDDADAEVICRQLGLSGVARAWTRAYFGEGSGPVLLDEVRCTGNELAIEECPKGSWGEHNCGHGEDAGVSCTPLTDGVLRLAGGKDSHEGRLEVYYGGQWGTVCDDGWTELNAHVVCRQLGFRHRPSLGFPIRLVDGENEREGRVEVFLRGQWGTICDDGWTDRDAAVTCRQLGYRYYFELLLSFGPSYNSSCPLASECIIGDHMFSVRNWHVTWISSFESRALADSTASEVGRHNCRHSEDAGVICDYFSKKAPGDGDKAPVPPGCGLRPLHRRQKRIVGGKNSLRYRLGADSRAEGLGCTRVQTGGMLASWRFPITPGHAEPPDLGAPLQMRGLRPLHRRQKRIVGGKNSLRKSGSGVPVLRGVCSAARIWEAATAELPENMAERPPLRYGNSSRSYAVRVGDYHTLVPEEFEEEIGVQQIVIHGAYRPDSSDHDIALVRLQGPDRQCARLSSHVLPACLPLWRERPQRTAAGCHITGWGDTGRAYARTLQQAAVPLLPRRR
ncbi:PREDICTED: neurotrypsin, partial [Myotis brandtii]|uniref:neurotrypsin n=1 Tax=Myotis brandtii TaxID=109478 RepID=UPI00070432E9